MKISLESLLLQKQEAVLHKWLCIIFEPFGPGAPAPTAAGSDRFTDPVGYTISGNAALLLNALINGEGPEASRGCLEKIIRIRAVQDLTKSQAAGFMADLKTVIRSKVLDEATKYGLTEELDGLEKRIDRLGHMADEIYIDMKRKIRELAIKEAKKDNDFRARISGIRRK